MTTSFTDSDINDVISLAKAWQTRANELITSTEKATQARLRKLMIYPRDKAFLTKMIDQSFRSKDVIRVADQLNFLLQRNGFPEFFSLWDNIQMWLFMTVGKRVPWLSVPLVISKIRKDSSQTIISGESDDLSHYLKKRREENTRMNLNHLGEAVLGEEEALFRLQTYLRDLSNPEIDYISIKISTLCSQIQPIAYDYTVSVLKERFSRIFRAAKSNYFTNKEGISTPKFVNLDMEAFNDLEMTVEVFRRVLDDIEFKNHSAGIVLQAYLPDSYLIQQELTAWAKKRVSTGGNPIKIRIVKGANMEMEQVDASINNWPLVPYNNKMDVDANYKRMVDFGLRDENFKAVHLGIASHNLFELAYAYKATQKSKAEDYVSFEMLTGMAEHVSRAIIEVSGDMILYAPVAAKHEFISAISYLIRRLDENTAGENFLRYSYNLRPNSKEWDFLEKQFIESCKHKSNVSSSPHRNQNRLEEVFPGKIGTYHTAKFTNEPNTDWALAVNRKWANAIREKWKLKQGRQKPDISLVISGRELFENRIIKDCLDPSQFNENIRTARFALATAADIEDAISTAKKDPDGWRRKTQNEKHLILSNVAREIRLARGELIGAAATTGKIFTEADVEVSEAVDFAEYYPYSMKAFIGFRNIEYSGKGVGVVISPWNFPIAIPCGGIVAALATGNTVIFKPSSQAVLPAWIVCQCFWKAGISKNTLQFVPCSGADVGNKLACHQDVDFVILTGGTETGIHLLKQKPDIRLAAETGGKNATIVTAISDRDQAISHVIDSAFGNGGQKCSATSLLILEKEVFQDETFKRQLVDAARSFKTGSAWDFENRMGPLIKPPDGDLRRALTQLEPGESWALKPENIQGNPHLWTPGIKWDVQPGSYTHMTEFFGPLLGVMLARDINHAIELVNQTGYGLTSGLECLDRRKQDNWKEKIKAGNLYINRGTTGAVTLRQPFGGMGKSAIGPGIKAGGPNYVSQFIQFTETG
ncbi:bifunctional proline dehydrogenase/L-glutamate gamma-semialdehyde dehydrogenase, partial [bacterium]|nr:bifunctional proline dehydrogenase/L-glutamate gamma-semialdehyde dehydrogenase [bacterium]